MNITKCATSKDYARLVGLFLAFFMIIFASSCLEGVNGQKSGRPIGTQQIVVNAFPVAVFGNACEFVDLEALFNELLTPDGATIGVVLNSSPLIIGDLVIPALPPVSRGCIASFDPVVVDGMAQGLYLSGALIGVGDLGVVDVVVTSTLQSDISASNFTPIIIQGVGIVSIVGPDMITSDPDVFATVEVDTVGIPPGTIVDFQLTNNSCGFLSNPTPVLGSVFQGVAIVQYNPVEGTECTQTIIVTIVLPDPPTKDPDCPSIPVADRTIQESATFDQLAPLPPTPSPTPPPMPTPTPGPTPTPAPGPSIDVMVANDVVEPNGTTIVTATTVNAPPDTDVCCDIPIQSDPISLLGFPPAAPPDCGVTDINGDFFTPLTCGNVVTLQTIQLRCCIDDSGGPNGQCDPDDVQNSTFVDCNPEGAPPPILLSANPSVIPPGGQSAITATTSPPVAVNTNICFDIVVDSNPVSTLVGGPCVGASSLGEAPIGLLGGLVMTQQSVTVRGCIDISGAPNVCDDVDPSGFVTVIISPLTPTPTPAPTPPPAAGITISSTNLSPSAGGNTIIDVVTNPSANNCVFFVVNSTTASTLQTINPLGATSTIEACGMAVSGQNSYRLNVDGTASGEQIRVQGCIDTMVTGCADDQDKLSNTLTFFIP